MVFQGKTGWWFWAIALGGIALMAFTGGVMASASSPVVLAVIAPCALMWCLLMVPPLVRNRVELREEDVRILFGFTVLEIPYAHIRRVARAGEAQRLFAGTATSLDRVFIEAPQEGDALVALKDNDAFIAALEARLD